MIRVVADDRIPFLKGALDDVVRVEYIPGSLITRADLRDADALIIRTRTLCNRDLLEGTAVRYITSATIGTDHIDTEYCDQAGIGFANAPGCNSSSVEQYMISVLLWLAAERDLDLTSLTLGIIGAGNVGSKVERAAGVLGIKVLVNDPPRQKREGGMQFVELDDLLGASDIISLHVPLNRGGKDNTFHMVDDSFIGKTGKGVILVNTSRGPVVNERSLRNWIRSGHLSGVVLDVFDNEPDINQDLLDMIILGTPHIAGYSLDGKASGTTMAVRSVSRFFGLGLDEWSPGSIPAPDNRALYMDAADGTDPGLLWELYRQTYDVTADDRSLREDPGAFEMLRGNYPPRREPPAYDVRVFQGDPEIAGILEGLGFSVLSDHCV